MCRVGLHLCSLNDFSWHDLIEPGQLTTNQRFHHSDLVTDFATVTSSQSEGLGKMVLGIVNNVYDHSSQLIGIIWLAVNLFAVKFVAVS